MSIRRYQMLPPWPPGSTAPMRVLLVGLLTPVLLIALAASLPALLVLPFLPCGTDRAIRLLAAHRSYLLALLTESRG